MLTVLHVAYPLAPVSLDACGGAEQVMAMLDRGLAARGHRSLAIACAGSRIEGRLLPVAVSPPFDEAAQTRARDEFRKRIQETLQSTPVGLVHMHGVDFYRYLPPPGIPVLATLHLPASYYPESVFRLSRPNTYLNCVSAAHRRTFPACPSLLATVDNGIPLDRFPEGQRKSQDYAMVLGRICPEKGVHLALDAAARACIPLWVAGAVFPYPAHQEYFRNELLPRLSPPHRFLGPADFATKVRLLSGARCLLLASTVPESSSLVAMEALACGTPVVAFASGAPADFIDHGKTGFLVRDVTEMAGAIRACGDIDSAECRRQARIRFSADRMVDRYIDLYRQVINRARPAPACA